jgi:hypothetical protein
MFNSKHGRHVPSPGALPVVAVMVMFAMSHDSGVVWSSRETDPARSEGTSRIASAVIGIRTVKRVRPSRSSGAMADPG